MAAGCHDFASRQSLVIVAVRVSSTEEGQGLEDEGVRHALFGHNRGVRFICPSIRTILYIWRALIDNFARYVFGL